MSQEHTTVTVNSAGSLENAIADLREEVRGLAVEISKAGGQPEKEVEPLRLLLGKRAADLQSLLDLDCLLVFLRCALLPRLSTLLYLTVFPCSNGPA
ncbi:J domain-containing protein [Mucor velutinosus]|uniref:J domain-containing protein n=1 Tax=Mucor velutinosus TaxID=708070 RepID=A0AAN7D556_9FUNG|nr:J domain-containing protein [Mucor velutinosus]